MFELGQKVTLNGEQYIISKCCHTEKYKVCMFCQQVNIKPPCIKRFDYPESEETFDLRKCNEMVPKGAIPKRI